MINLKNLCCFSIVFLFAKLSLAVSLVELGFHFRARGMTPGTHYAYEDLQVNFYLAHGKLLSCHAFKKINNEEIELEFPEKYFEKLDKLYKMQKPLRKQKIQDEKHRLKAEALRREEERQRKLQEHYPKDMQKIDDAINQLESTKKDSKKSTTPDNVKKDHCCATM